MNELKSFDKVLVRVDNSTDWACDLYSHYVDNLKLHCCVGGLFSQAIPYEGNEHLLGTTDSPQPKRWRAEENGSYWFVNSDGKRYEVCDTREYWDNMRYNVGNYFQTKEEAEAKAQLFKQILIKDE